MTTASALISDIRTKIGDTDGNFLGDTLGLTWLDQAQKTIVEILQPLDRTKSFTVSANTDSFAVPSDVIMIEVAYNTRDLRRILKRVTPGEFELAKIRVPNAVGTPTLWTERDGRIYVWPLYSTASLTTTVNASTTTTATTITLASTGNLRTSGRVIIDSEEIEYTNKTSTTIVNCLRGAGGTTAATHVSAATVTQTDFALYYTRHATALSATDSPEIKPVWHEKLEYWVMYLTYMAEGSMDKANAMLQLWNKTVEDARYIAEREHLAGPLTVKDIDSQRVTNLFGPSL